MSHSTDKANKAIGCTITNCVNHYGMENYCSLPKILVGTHEQNPDRIECTDCESFKLR